MDDLIQLPQRMLSAGGMDGDSADALDRALVALLLLIGLLSLSGSHRRLGMWSICAGIMLALLDLPTMIVLPWRFLLAVILPPLLWQIAAGVALAQSTLKGRNLLAWLLTAILISGALLSGGGIPLTSSVLCGVLAASLIWQTREQHGPALSLGAIGLWTLALLVTEIDVISQPVHALARSLIVGAGLGVIAGYLGVLTAARLPAGAARNRFCLGLTYGGYVAGTLFDASAVMLAATTALVLASYGIAHGVWSAPAMLPMLLNQRWVLLLLGGGFLLVGWQSDGAVAWHSGIGMLPGLGAAALGLLIRQRVASATTAIQPGRRELLAPLATVGLLFLGMTVLWPNNLILGPWTLGIALLAAVGAIGLLLATRSAVAELIGSAPQQQRVHPLSPKHRRNGQSPYDP